MKVGDLVKYEDVQQPGTYLLGYITDIMEFEDGSFPAYEVICTDPYDRGWFSDMALEVISESR